MRIHVVDVAPGSGAGDHRWDRHTRHVVPAVGDPAREAALARLVHRHGIDLVVPTNPDELIDLAAAATSFPPGVDIVVSGTAGLVHARDSFHALRRLARAGIPTARIATPSDYLDQVGGPDLPRERLALMPRSAWQADQAVPLLDPRTLDHASFGDAYFVIERPPGPHWRVLSPGLGESSDGLDGVVAALGPAQGAASRAVPRRPQILQLATESVRALQVTGPVELTVAEDECTLRVTGVVPGLTAAFTHSPFLLDIALGLVVSD
ncbi:hypothetical protein BCF74_11170 [Knoellia remsis]|uniref:ATP-grasp domain-containing protein n=1 Tax=Knoellia remsis TaxID=407159 RepID=A0A2T0ULH2_9MICO|nr:hypothetical protein [Knoellia remsis]PRY58789.1 hypothetical protein BCF74_11170 [Knoellia remsis]